MKSTTLSILLMTICLNLIPVLAQPIQGGIQENQANAVQPNYDSQSSFQGNANMQPLQGNANMQPLQGNVSVNLPPQFLGQWLVQSQRIKVEAQPQFQAGANNAFAVKPPTAIWNITGSQATGYQFSSNTGVNCPIIVDKATQNTAYIRYQHPINNTMAQEAVVLNINATGNQFDGLERISIIKQGISEPRAKVTYQLFGSRK